MAGQGGAMSGSYDWLCGVAPSLCNVCQLCEVERAREEV